MLLAEENVVLAGKGLSRWLSIIEARDKVEEEKRENFHWQVLKSPPWGDLEGPLNHDVSGVCSFS